MELIAIYYLSPYYLPPFPRGGSLLWSQFPIPPASRGILEMFMLDIHGFSGFYGESERFAGFPPFAANSYRPVSILTLHFLLNRWGFVIFLLLYSPARFYEGANQYR